MIHAHSHDNTLHAAEVAIGAETSQASARPWESEKTMTYKRTLIVVTLLCSLTAFATIFGTVNGLDP